MRTSCIAAVLVMFAAGAASAGEVELSGGMTMVGQWIAAGDEASLPDGRIGEMSSSFDLEAQTQFSPRLRGYLHLEASAGGGIDAHVTMYGAANADAAGTAAAEVSEAWLEGNLGAGWTVFVGKADVSAIVDANDVAGDETAQFLNASFRNSTAAFFPMDNAAAAWLSWVPEDGPVEAVVGWAEADADWQFVFEDPYLFGEVGLRLGPSGERGRVGNPSYNASKAALTCYLEALRNRLTRRGVHVLTVKPGYVLTDMVAGVRRTLFAVSPERAAADINRAIRRRKQEIYTAPIWRLVMLVVRNIPSFLFRRMTF